MFYKTSHQNLRIVEIANSPYAFVFPAVRPTGLESRMLGSNSDFSILWVLGFPVIHAFWSCGADAL